jgi:hypothetical protein
LGEPLDLSIYKKSMQLMGLFFFTMENTFSTYKENNPERNLQFLYFLNLFCMSVFFFTDRDFPIGGPYNIIYDLTAVSLESCSIRGK